MAKIGLRVSWLVSHRRAMTRVDGRRVGAKSVVRNIISTISVTNGAGHAAQVRRGAPRSFNPISIPGLSNDAREAVNAALKAMSAWRNETADTSQKNSKQVIEKMATAAAALGWPEQIVDAARAQMQTITEMQIKTEVAPLSWTPDLLSLRSPQWQKSTHMRRNSAGR